METIKNFLMKPETIEVGRLLIIFAVGYAVYCAIDWIADRQQLQELRRKDKGGQK